MSLHHLWEKKLYFIFKPTFSRELQGEGMSQTTETELESMKTISSKPSGPEMSGSSFLEESIRAVFLPACTRVSEYLNYGPVFHCTLTLRAQCFIGRRLIQLTHPGASSQAQTDLLTAGIGGSTGHCSSSVPLPLLSICSQGKGASVTPRRWCLFEKHPNGLEFFCSFKGKKHWLLYSA